MKNTNGAIVHRFCEAFERLDPDELISYFHDDAVYHNVPLAPLRGRAQILDSFRGLRVRFQSMRFETLRQVESGDTVMNERIDYLTLQDRHIVLSVMGVFELHGGKIVAWRDYFDLGQLRGDNGT